MKATDFVVKTTKEYVEQMPKAQRKKKWANFSQVQEQHASWQSYLKFPLR